jgi:hypothetical protein
MSGVGTIWIHRKKICIVFVQKIGKSDLPKKSAKDCTHTLFISPNFFFEKATPPEVLR